jgi:hypothetical protein
VKHLPGSCSPSILVEAGLLRGRPSEAAASEPFPFYFSRGRPSEAAPSILVEAGLLKQPRNRSPSILVEAGLVKQVPGSCSPWPSKPFPFYSNRGRSSSFYFSRGGPSEAASKPFPFYFSRGRPCEAGASKLFPFHDSRGRPSKAFPFYFNRGRAPEKASHLLKHKK